jgi:hypothetical protein
MQSSLRNPREQVAHDIQCSSIAEASVAEELFADEKVMRSCGIFIVDAF